MASSKTLEQAIANITIWRKGEQRAPHKPLLLLYVLANYQQGHARLFDYGIQGRGLWNGIGGRCTGGECEGRTRLLV